MNTVLRRAMNLPVIMLGVSAIVFIAIHALPGDPARLMAGPQAPEGVVAAIHERLGLNQSLLHQYGHFLRHALQGDFGLSLRDGAPVGRMIAGRLPYSLLLGGLAYLLAMAVAIPGGIVGAVCANRWPDHLLMAMTLLGASLASFWVALIGMEVFAVRLHWLPLMGAGDWHHVILPVLVLALMPSALILRMTRTGMRDILRQDYIRTARAKGLSPMTVLLRHALRNAMIPVVTVVFLNLGGLISGAIVTETVFDWPGIGRLLIDAVRYRDYPTIQAITLLSIFGVLSANLLAEAIIVYLDPRMRGHK
ncbi:dipeptide/oligopeptide/nickel ABC transporter permease [Neoasaia chiangmaiensis NBRC 101099]|uniref:Peptide ABC transporter permease n=1 Tax=Neoasaia chiangmaiensis TaxID=320497 RepID=A0A1U9KP82_9PROT|nr:ABC transporter permease [Neoasaia chiangmaiensis]AQS87539.1 peptide ABC transporter permease [Neoasaia chiangmaiensis]GBR42348.1 dipeptide/oligopeptide/nickel ABC transporter permease [Neoasaia chiangmaiensis NBRC 101099]GEN14081.1 glutathione ABC transporter permease [Neoasaia chiangmaiensis]